MEELRSTEALDNEIRNDARKKAEQILAKAEKTALSLIENVNQKVQDEEAAAQKNCDARLALYKKNKEAALPLEKQRYLVLTIHNAVIDAMNEYFDALKESERLDIIRMLVERSKDLLDGKTFNATIIGFKKLSADRMLKKVLGKAYSSGTVGDERLISDEAVKGFNRREGVVLQSEDGSMICRFTLDEKIKEILDTYSRELAETLFCGRIPE
ncbi:MAG: hypothetical protein IJ828_06985 [Treponema sp.]|nr:hypothetical protein [Treponema sp.]